MNEAWEFCKDPDKVYGMPQVDEFGHVWAIMPVDPGMTRQSLAVLWADALKQAAQIRKDKGNGNQGSQQC